MNSFVETLKQLGPARLGVMAAILAGLLMFFVFVSMRVSAPQMKLLYTDLSPNDASAIAAKLEENEIGYDLSYDSSKMMVPDNEVGRARMLLAQAGLPNGGSLGYELFDEQSGFGTTSFVQNVNQVRALEGELSRTISSLENVRSARVHLVLPQRQLFSREARTSSASVFLGVRAGAVLEREQIVAIQSLIASAVPDLKVSNVSIVDNSGKLLARGGEDDSNLMSTKTEERRIHYERQLTEKIEDQVSRIVGFGNVRATVTAEMNFDQVSMNEELFDPEKQVVRSSQVTEENNTEREPLKNDVSVQNNLPGIGGDLLADNQPSAASNRTEEVTNFEISKTIRSTVREVGEIKRLSVAVLVDGRYNTDAEGKKVYEPRSQEELDQITALARSATGMDESRGDVIEVVNLQFAQINTEPLTEESSQIMGFEKDKLLDIGQFLIVGVMIVLVSLLVLQPMINRLLETGPANPDEDLRQDLLEQRARAPALEGPSSRQALQSGGEGDDESLIDLQGVEGKVRASTVKKVEEIIETYPAETVSVIRSWMTQES
ncbi:MAG: flagellar M-ring protein FliF [Alphaproteobacteria bacterium]|nr:flagellar M-ring protein FliF [Alphaproteobacteria bacterium]